VLKANKKYQLKKCQVFIDIDEKPGILETINMFILLILSSFGVSQQTL